MLWKKATLLGLAGFILGLAISAAFRFFASSVPSVRESLPDLLAGGLYGAVAMGSSVVYEIEKWSIARATATHFLLCFGLYCLVSLALGWFRIGDSAFWIVIAVMAAAYVLIWWIMYLSYRRKVRKMNDDLRRMKSGEGEG